jgi:guanyl-specific ribonuclease Sa
METFMRFLLPALLLLWCMGEAHAALMTPTAEQGLGISPSILQLAGADSKKGSAAAKDDLRLPKGVPAKVAKVLKYIDEHHKAPDGYEGGRTFGNFEKLLPLKDDKGRSIKYHEWDVNPHKPGVNRGPERLVTGSDGSAHYTGDHYKSFKKIR